MKKVSIIAAVGTGLALTAATSQAQVVLNNDVNVNTTTLYTGPSGTPATTQSPLFSATQLGTTQSGNLTSEVFQPTTGGLTDPAGYTGITFVFQVSETGNTYVDHISLDGFNLSSVDIEYASGTGSAPVYANLSAGTLTIDFSPNNVLTGHTSDVIYVFTTAQAYTTSGATVDDGVSANTTDYSPAPVPEASTVLAGALMLLPLGIGAVRAIRKERTA